MATTDPESKPTFSSLEEFFRKGLAKVADKDDPIYSSGLSMNSVKRSMPSTPTSPTDTTGGPPQVTESKENPQTPSTSHPMQEVADGLEEWAQKELERSASDRAKVDPTQSPKPGGTTPQ
jgi:hypothetical protein